MRLTSLLASLWVLGSACGEVPGLDAGLTTDGGADADAGGTAPDLDAKLRLVPGLTFVKAADSGFPGTTRYDLTFVQPVDHLRPDAGTFPQRLFLLATSPTAPMVLSTTGYFLSTRRSDLARVYTANQLTYEFRYFSPSRPAGPIDWSTNTVRQAAEDAHRLVQAFRPLFPAKWVSTGISKGGMSSVYHRRFFPDDVDATVPMVTPFSASRSDPRYPAFLSTVGGATRAGCRQALIDFQRACLTRRLEVQPLMPGSFARLTRPTAFEHAVIETAFGFWQWTAPADPSFGCSRIPAANDPAQDLADFIDVHAGWTNFTDSDIANYEGFFASSALELGSPEPFDAPLAPLVTEPGAYGYTDARYQPPGFSATYTAATQLDVTQWVSTRAERMLFVVGEFDPWSAGAYAPSPGLDNFVMTVTGGNHGVFIGDLPPAMQSLAWSTLDRWLGATAVPSARARLPEPVEAADPRGPM